MTPSKYTMEEGESIYLSSCLADPEFSYGYAVDNPASSYNLAVVNEGYPLNGRPPLLPALSAFYWDVTNSSNPILLMSLDEYSNTQPWFTNFRMEIDSNSFGGGEIIRSISAELVNNVREKGQPEINGFYRDGLDQPVKIAICPTRVISAGSVYIEK